MHSVLAKRYAKAMLDASERGHSDKLEINIRDLNFCFRDSSEIGSLFEKLDHFPDVCQCVCDYLVAKFDLDLILKRLLDLLVSRKKISLFPSIVSVYEDLKLESDGKIRVQVICCRSLESHEKNQIMIRLKKFFLKEVVIDWQVDKDILGGILIRSGDRIFDGTLKSKIEQLRTFLASASKGSYDKDISQ